VSPPEDKVSKKKRQDDLPLLSHHCSCLSLLDRLICDIVGLGKPIIVVLSVCRPRDGAALLSGYSRILPDLRTELPEHQHLR
jgi:hypothetical protein